MTDPLATLAQLEGIPSAVTSTLDTVDAIMRDRGLRQIPAEESAKSLLAGARASAAMEDAADGVARWEAPSVRLSTQLIDLAPMIRTSPGQAIAKAHQVLARGIADDDQLGRPSSAPEVADRLVGLYGLLTGQTQASALVVAAIAHAEVATSTPFVCGNGIVARAVEHMVLIEAGIDPRAVLVVEEGHRASGRVYRDALEAYVRGDRNGVREWILHCVRVVAHGAEVSPLAKLPVRTQQGTPRGNRTTGSR